jgi:sigma-B regulation protein RsbU (phosphoserine phosphatase)
MREGPVRTQEESAERREVESVLAVCPWHEGEPPEGCRYRDLTAFLQEILDLDDLLNACTAFVHRLVRARRVRIWLLRRGGRRLLHREFDAGLPEGYRELRHDPDESLLWRIVESKEPWSGMVAPEEFPATAAPRGGEPALYVPLLRRDKALGVIECRGHADDRPYRPDEVRVLGGLSADFAVAIENAQLYHDTRRRAAERAVLLRVSQALSRSLSLSDTLEAILDALSRIVHYDAAAIYLLSADTLNVEAHASRGLPGGMDRWLRLSVGEGIVGWVAKTGESVIVPDTSEDRRYVSARPETRSEMACPLVTGGRVIGVFNLEADREDTYTDAQLEILHSFAAQAAAAVERARLLDEVLARRNLERELAIAREIQSSFLPTQDPEIAGYEVAGLNLPYAEVGGDYYDFIRVQENQYGVAISDVSGKGVPAALLMAAYRASLLAEIRNHFTLRAIFSKVNTLLHESTDRGKFVTAFYGVLDARNHVLTFVNAGHNPPLLWRAASGRLETLAEAGLPLGVLPDARYDEQPVELRPGDVFFLYTDGVSEAVNPDQEQFGAERIEQVLTERHAATARQIVDAIRQRVIHFAGGPDRLADDLTVVCLKRAPAA